MGKNTTPSTGENSQSPSGLISFTSRSFIQRHSDPAALMEQLKTLYKNGEHQSCKDLIELICEERHPLSGSGELFVLRAQIAFEEEPGFKAADLWLKQALLTEPSSQIVQDFALLLEAQSQLADGLYQQGCQALEGLIDSLSVGMFAKYLLGRHLLLKTQNTESAINQLESALQIKPKFKMGWEALGFAFSKTLEKAKAQEAFARCIELETNPEKLNFYKQQLAS